MTVTRTDRLTDGDADTVRWLSYSQIAALRGISRTSAERMVRRAKWRRQVDNQGVTKAAVPLAYVEPVRANPPDSQADNPPDFAAFEIALAAVREAQAGEIAALRDQNVALQGQVDLLLKAQDGQTVLVAELKAERDQARAAAQAAQDAAEELRQEETARRARGRWARLWDAWRG
jgi:hypothetical protein